jgi:hypothetical protein
MDILKQTTEVKSNDVPAMLIFKKGPRIRQRKRALQMQIDLAGSRLPGDLLPLGSFNNFNSTRIR